jgi:twinkle protein
MADIVEIKRMLASRAQSVAEHLLPGGRKDGAEWRAGSVHGEKGDSLGVRLAGDKAGVWKDFASDHGGDLLDLWVAARSVTLAEAIDEARSWLGLERPTLHRPVKREYTRPPKPQCRAPQGRVRDYLVEDRNIPAEVLDRYRIGEAGDDIVFPFLLPDGTLALVKKRRAEDGAKPKPTAADCEPVLFGWQAVPADAREILIAEGEIDALSWATWGLVASTSVPFGGGGGNKQQWIENDFERLDRFERIYLATDMDEQGDAAAEEIADRLGRHRCLRVRMPHKDGNACLIAGLTRDDMARCIAEAAHLDPEGLRRPSDYGDNVVAMFWPTEGSHVGYRTPYGKLGEKLLFRPGEVTIWTGDSGAGKSQLLSDCAIDWRAQGARMCLSSLEMKPAQTLKRMVKQVVGTDWPTEAAIRGALRWLDDGLLLYELVGKAKLDELLAIFDYARAKYGCDTFAVDSLMRLGIAGDDYNGQEQAMFRLTDWTIARNAHLHLVAHSKKGDRDRGSPDTGDIKGAMEIGANAFNIISVWRNRKIEDEIRAAEALVKMGDATAQQTLDALLQKPGVVANVAKQRNGDFEGKIGLWFDQETYQYRSAHDRAEPRRYLPHGWSDAA